MKADSKSILAGASSGTALAILTIVVNVILYRWIFEYLPKDVAGIWFLFLSIGGYIAFFDFGISPTVGREISLIVGKRGALAFAQTQYIADLMATLNRLLRGIAIAVFIAGSIVGVVYLSTADPAAGHLSITTSWFLYLAGAGVMLVNAGAFAILAGTGDVVTEKMARGLVMIGGLPLFGLSLHLGVGIVGLAAVVLVQAVCLRLVGAWAQQRNWLGMRCGSGIPRAEMARGVVVSGLKLALTVAGGMLTLYTDNVVIAATLGPEHVPNYEAAAKIVYMLMTLALLVVTNSAPFLAQSFGAGDFERVRLLILRNIRLGGGVVVVGAAPIAVFGDWLVELWLGPGSFVGFPVLWTMLGMVVLYVHYITLTVAAHAVGRVVFVTVTIISGILNVAISLALVGKYGVLGVAMGTLLAIVLTNTWYAPYVVFRIFDLEPKKYFTTTLLPIGWFVIAALGVNYGIRVLVSYGSGIVGLFAGLVIAGFISAVLWLFIVARADERIMIVNFFNHLLGRKIA